MNVSICTLIYTYTHVCMVVCSVPKVEVKEQINKLLLDFEKGMYRNS